MSSSTASLRACRHPAGGDRHLQGLGNVGAVDLPQSQPGALHRLQQQGPDPRRLGAGAGDPDGVVGLAMPRQDQALVEAHHQRPQEQVGQHHEAARGRRREHQPGAGEGADHGRAPERGGGVEAMDR